jgi:hypothetical protein
VGGAHSIRGIRRVGARHSWSTPWPRVSAHQQKRLATRSHDWECLALWNRGVAEEGDAFLVGVRIWEIALLMGGGP